MNIGETLDLSEEKLKEATAVSEQLLSDSFVMLHVTGEENLQSILSNGLRHSNPHISLTTAIPENAEDIALYTYSQGWDKEAKIIIAIPYEMFDKKNGDELSKADMEYLTCAFEKKDGDTYGYAMPSLFIKGHFDNDMNFVKNPDYILNQANAKELMQSYSKKMTEEFFKWAEKREEKWIEDKIKKSVESDLKKQGYDKSEILKAMKYKPKDAENLDVMTRIKNAKIQKEYSELNEKYSKEIKNLEDLLPKTAFTGKIANKSFSQVNYLSKEM